MHARVRSHHGEGSVMPKAVNAGTEATTTVDSHARLLSQEDLARYDKATSDLDLKRPEDQAWMVEWLEGKFEKHPELAPAGASAVDVVIEYLIVGKGLVAGEVSREVMCHDDANLARRIHLAREAHDRREKQQRRTARSELNFISPSVAS